MSILSKDRLILDDKRKNKLKDVSASLRDQVVQKLFKKLEEDGVGVKLSKAWYQSSANITAHLERQKTFLAELDVHLPADADSDAPTVSSTSNLHLPIPFIVAKSYHARFNQALLGVDPPFSAKARREDGTDSIQIVEDLMRYVIFDWANRNRGMEEQIDKWLWNWITTGTGILKDRWLCEYERIIDVANVPHPQPPKVVMGEDGQESLQPQPPQYIEEEVAKTIKTFEGPMSEVIDLEDFRMIGGEGDPDLADIVFHRTRFTASELWTMSDRGIFDEDGVDKLISKGRRYVQSMLNGEIKQQRAMDAGQAAAEGESDTDRYEVIEACLKYQVDASGIASDIVVWLDVQGVLLGATYLRRILPSGKRPYSVIHFHKRPGSEYGVGLIEVLYPLSKELDAMHNIRIDTGLFTNMPFFFYKPTVGMDAEKIMLEPGMGYPLNNPQSDVYFPTISNKTSFTSQEEQVIQSYIERLTGLSDLSMGLQTGTQGAARTATGARALLGESNLNLDIHLKRMNRGWKKALHLKYDLIKTRIPRDFMFRITNADGEDLFRQIPYGEGLPDCDFELSANSANSNKQVQIETNSQIMQITMNPINIQLGICGPAQIYESQKAYAQSLGVRDASRFLKKPAGDTYVLQPMDEFFRVVRGQNVPISIQSDHKGFIAFAQTMIDHQNETRTLSEDQIHMAIAQMQKHQQMQAALDQQAANANVQQQMQQNAMMSQSQAPTAMNPMAGMSPGQLPMGPS